MTTVRCIGAPWACMKPEEPLERGEYRIVSGKHHTAYDWLVVYDEFPRRRDYPEIEHGRFRLACPREHTILLTQEPTSVKFYNRVYTGQFGHLLTNRPRSAEPHPHYHFGRGYYAWFISRTYPEARAFVAPPKTHLVSAVYSAKKMRHTMHHARSVLLDYLMDHVDGLDRFGKGVRPIEKKEDALDTYKYHIAVENHIGVGHWSEKIADALLCECLPFYAGDPSLASVLPPGSFIPIPIGDPVRAAEIINTSIRAGEYEKRLPAIREARRLILEKYNFRDQIIDVIEEARAQEAGHPPVLKPGDSLMTRHRTRLTLRGACGDLAHHLARLV